LGGRKEKSGKESCGGGKNYLEDTGQGVIKGRTLQGGVGSEEERE